MPAGHRKEVLRLVRRLCVLTALAMGRHVASGGAWQGLYGDPEIDSGSDRDPTGAGFTAGGGSATGATSQGMASPSASQAGASENKVRCWLC